MRKSTGALGDPLDDGSREQIRTLVGRIGEREAAKALGVSDRTLVRGLAGLGLYPGSRALIRLKLMEL